MFKKAVEVFGDFTQLQKGIQEAAELIVVVSKMIEGRCDKRHVAEEIADIEVICQSLREIIGNELVDEIKTIKMIRLQARMREEVKLDGFEDILLNYLSNVIDVSDYKTKNGK